MTRSRLLGVFVIFTLLVAVPLTVFILKQQQDVRQRASIEDPNIVALVGTEAVTKSEIDEEIKKGEPTDIQSALENQKLRKEKLETLIEEKLIRQEAKTKQVAVSAGDVQEEKSSVMKDLAPAVASEPALLATDVLSLQVLTDKVHAKVTTSRTIDKFVVNKSPADPAFNAQLETARKSLEVIRKLLQEGKSSEDVYIQAQKTAGFDKNIQFIPGEVVEGDTKFIKRFKDPIFALHKNGISAVIDSFGGTLMVFKVINENNTSYPSYDAWLLDMKTKNVTVK